MVGKTVPKEQRPSWNNSVIFIKGFTLLTSSRHPNDKSYSILKEYVKDPFIKAKLKFIEFIAARKKRKKKISFFKCTLMQKLLYLAARKKRKKNVH